MTEQTLILRLGGGDAREVFFRDDQHVDRGFRVNVVDGDAQIVFVGDLRGDFSIDDFLKERFHSRGDRRKGGLTDEWFPAR